MKTGDKIQVRLKAKHSYGTRNNPIIAKTIDKTSYHNGELDIFTFKGGKTEYRICGNEIYAITGNDKFYELIN
jgi:hypothetical protein